ncbi:ATP synthase subunit d, mitochondrial-like [Lagenorhynchus albirostris]|uniref:ATP synthase subunit d, mitochondrial-like n=1 Tax=Lagenorhynchus albirostris TaxID=27610 RepID=UPI0028E59228|nr:ATP synthase subunit d, mitochondrial-like [Lagenorhynchus albirostris]
MLQLIPDTAKSGQGMMVLRNKREDRRRNKIRIEEYEKDMEKMKNIIPFDKMTIEDLNEIFPETKLGKKKYPYQPHKPTENL